jgi:hypothetical protein
MKCSTQHEVTFSEQADIFNCSQQSPRARVQVLRYASHRTG